MGKMVTICTELSSEELKAIGASIVSVDNPDLSMFPVNTRDQILSGAFQYLGRWVHHHQYLEGTLAKVVELLPRFTGAHYRDGAVHYILDAAKGSEWIEAPILQAVAPFGFQDQAQRKAVEFLSVNRARINVFDPSLEEVIALYAAGAENLSTPQRQAIAFRYILGAQSSTRLSQGLAALNLEDLPILKDKVGGHLVSDFLLAGESQLYQYERASVDPEPKVINGFYELAGKLYGSDAHSLADLALVAAKERYMRVSWHIAREASRAELTEGTLGVLDSVANQLFRQGYFLKGDEIARYNPTYSPIEPKQAFDIFRDSIVNPLRYSSAVHAEMKQYLLGLPQEIIANNLAAFEELVSAGETEVANHRARLAQDFLKDAYLLLNDEAGARRIAAREIPAYTKSGLPERNQGPHRETLYDTLKASNSFTQSVLDAYDANGHSGVEDLLHSRASNLDASSLSSVGYLSAVRTIDDAITATGRDYSDGDRKAFVHLALNNGPFSGYPAGVYFEQFDSDSHPLDPHTTLQFALSAAIGFLPYEMGGEGTHNPIDVAELVIASAKAQGINGVHVPQMYYRAVAMKALVGTTYPDRDERNGKIFSQQPVWVSAAYSYQALGDPGLVAFMDRNFGSPHARPGLD